MDTQTLTEKELAVLGEELAAEQQLVKKFQACAQAVNDPELKTVCEQMANKHQRHFEALMTHLK